MFHPPAPRAGVHDGTEVGFARIACNRAHDAARGHHPYGMTSVLEPPTGSKGSRVIDGPRHSAINPAEMRSRRQHCETAGRLRRCCPAQ
jgi:hypothetical protein